MFARGTSGGLDGEIPVREGQLRVDKLQVGLERVGQLRVARQKTEAVVELPKPKRYG